jgi:hypothetical protein
MTATQVFMLFLKETCTIDELRFFKHTIMQNHGNKYFRKRPLFTPTFVEDYLARNNRCLNNYMTRLFVLAPNLKNERHKNPRWSYIKRDFAVRNEGKKRLIHIRDWWGEKTGETRMAPVSFHPFKCGMYVNYYKRSWNKFLKENIVSEKKINSPFKKGECYDFKLKTEL